MKHRITTLLATSALAALLSVGAAWADDDDQAAPAPAAAAPAAPAAPAPSPAPYPSMSPTIAANPNPATFDAGPFLGKIMVGGVLSGGGFYQDNPQLGDFISQHFNYCCHRTMDDYGDVDNAMVFINKADGPVQFFVQAGAYSIQTLGSPYYRSTTYDNATYGYVPVGFVKLVPDSHWSFEAGSLPTLIGAEYTFSFQNMNIERGLLWNQEPVFSKGAQVNFTDGPWAVSAAWTDGYYSDTFTAASGSVTYTFKNSDTLVFAAEGNVTPNHASSFVTPVEQNNGQIYNLIYSHSQGPWTITPYFQYSNSPKINGYSASGDTWGGAILAKYSFTPEVSVAGRVEYIKSDGDADLLGYGVDSSAWSLTLTPGYQHGVFFIRGEVSYVGLTGYKGPTEFAFGQYADKGDQFRFAGEAGLVF